ncbi:hypothetical protein AHMF7605_17315 [Adhaeribacter arboris]|uniref:Multidrug transporter n=1 Tax=Adhaeribacter arboris TaxID=2072846 RepID=A0A2T2YI31_9BACT|nr:bestrophin family ion channel [Adhaeribacter arboris]PSR55138.1 hypothetical protein AHMF7605_17315 [Adhaeribacter arboris]
MVVKKNVSLKDILSFAGHHFIWFTAWSVSVACLYYFTDLKQFSIPWLPLSLIGTAVAFYVGFKNNQAYDRVWEGRKIWGSIVNSSRSWGSMVKHFANNQHTTQPRYQDEINALKEKIIYRHIAWVYTLRSQLLINTDWEHVNLKGSYGKLGQQRQKKFGTGLFEDGIMETNLSDYLPKEELALLDNFENTATHIIDKQAEELTKLRSLNLIDDFRHMELQKILNEFYAFQGMAERIKKFPLPRQYANASFIFVCLFIFMLPFGMVSEFSKLGNWGIWLSVPFMVIVGWIFVVMELVGDYSENPFEGLATDVPMLSICRTIEIDLLQMLGKKDIPKPIQAKNGILM